MPVPTLSDVKQSLNITSGTDDAELQDLLDDALAEYAKYVRPLPGTVSVTVSGGRAVTILPAGSTAVTAAVYSDGTVIDVTDFDVSDSGLLHWPGWAAYGRRNITLTVTVGDMPGNHRRAILFDVQELWTRTQRGGGTARPSFGGEGFTDLDTGLPLTLFPRIRALAPPTVL